MPEQTRPEQTRPEQTRPEQTRPDRGAADDESAPVDRQSDPAYWLPGRTVVVAAIVSTVILVVTIVICLLTWIGPGMAPLQIPELDKA